MAMCVEDRISSFPDPILCHILSFLPIKEAVRTSIISTKWRYLFASISTIKFDGYSMSGLTDRNIDNFKNFVDRLLKSPDQIMILISLVGYVLHCAVVLRKLICSYLEDILPAVLFTYGSLVTLKLDAVVINAPNLIYFQCTDAVAQGYTLSTMKSLEKAHISICDCDTIDSQTIATHLIQVCNVRSLRLTINEIFRTSKLPIFHNLIEFEFLGRGFNGREIWLVEFLHRMPNLKTLTLNFPVVAGTQWKALEVSSCLSFHLKEIEISRFNTHMIGMPKIAFEINM
ncbi:hypothetical protein GOBAR_DD24446 [Gossypium barbadense]|nr:hypothetical protein GOBAR_DD24446 [Gossypium barbadense]